MKWDKLLEYLLAPFTTEQRWRLVVGFVIAAFMFHIAWACGRIPGLDGFASAQSVEQQKASLTQVVSSQNIILIRLISADIETARQAQCRSIAAGNGAAADGWRASLDAALREYQQANNGKPYRLRACNEY